MNPRFAWLCALALGLVCIPCSAEGPADESPKTAQGAPLAAPAPAASDSSGSVAVPAPDASAAPAEQKSTGGQTQDAQSLPTLTPQEADALAQSERLARSQLPWDAPKSSNSELAAATQNVLNSYKIQLDDMDRQKKLDIVYGGLGLAVSAASSIVGTTTSTLVGAGKLGNDSWQTPILYGSLALSVGGIGFSVWQFIRFLNHSNDYVLLLRSQADYYNMIR